MRPCAYYANSVATFYIVLDVGDLVFKLYPGITGNAHITSIVSSRIESRAYPCRKPARDTLISVERNIILGYLDSRAFQLFNLNARSLRNKSSAFVDLVCDLSPGLLIVILRFKRAHSIPVIRRGGRTALLYRDGLDVNKVFSADRSSFEVSEWLVEFGTVRLRVVIVYRPTYSADHPVTTSVFFHEFSDH